jgi:alpha-D-ribose 1-methylphosphonate 5-triphosphate synthase subunit PhnL
MTIVTGAVSGALSDSPDERASVSIETDTSVILDVRSLEKHFVLHSIDGRRVEGLRGIDLVVHAGEHVALAGSSGAGKSSLLKAIYRTYLPSAGEVWLRTGDGPADVVELTALPDAELAALRGRAIGYVSQFLRAEPRRGPLEIVARAGRSRGMDRDEALEAAALSLRRLHLDESLWDVHAAVLSGGEKQRVNLAAGTISPPRLLLLDEPVSALDPANREAALALIDDLTTHGVAVLAVFHDLDAMDRLATRVVVLSDGVVVDQGPPSVVLAELTGIAR